MAAYKSGAVAPTTNEIVYKYLGLSFTPLPVTKKLNVLKNENAVKRAVRNLILTNTYERFYNPLFGGNITSFLFENFTPADKLEMEKQIEDTIKIYEPRAVLLEVNVDESNVDRNQLTVSIFFRLVNQTEPTQLSFTVERVR